MMPRLLIPVGRWKVNVEFSSNKQAPIRLSGRALSDTSQPASEHGFLLTPDQAHELIIGLNMALLDVELQRAAELG